VRAVHRAAVALVLVVLGVGTPAAATVARGASGRVIDVPDDIATDCSVDTTASLAAVIAEAPKNSTIRLAPDGCYRVDGTLLVYEKTGLTLDGRGATLQAVAQGARTRRHLMVRGGRNLVIRNLAVKGVNPNAGPSRDSFVGRFAFQHGIALHGVDGTRIENVQVGGVYGDLVYIGVNGKGPRARWSRDVTITDSVLDGSGRQGVAIVAGKRIAMDGNYIGGAGQSLIDLEANSGDGGAVDVRITNNTTGAARHFWLANKGAGLKIRDIVVRKNTAVEPTAGLVFVYGPTTGYRGPYRFEGNTFAITGQVWDEGSKGAFFLSRARDVEIRNNTLTLPAGRGLPAVENRDSLDVVLSGNTFVNAGEELLVTQRVTPPTTLP
jgi:hypothetical protein